MAGYALGGIVFPPIYRIILDEYGLRGGLIITAGFILNSAVSAMLLRPPSFYRIIRKFVNTVESDGRCVPRNPNENTNPHLGEDTEYEYDKCNTTVSVIEENDEIGSGVGACNCSMDGSITLRRSAVENSQKIPEKNGSESINETTQINPNLSNIEDLCKQVSASMPFLPIKDVTDDSFVTLSAVKSMNFDCTFERESLVPLCVLGSANSDVRSAANMQVHDSATEITNNEILIQENTKSRKHFLSKFRNIDQGLLKNRTFVLFVVIYSFGNVAVATAPVYLATLGDAKGLSASDISLCLSLNNILDFIGRILAGLLADSSIMSSRQIVFVSQIIIGIITQFTQFYTSFAGKYCINGRFSLSRICVRLWIWI